MYTQSQLTEAGYISSYFAPDELSLLGKNSWKIIFFLICETSWCHCQFQIVT